MMFLFSQNLKTFSTFSSLFKGRCRSCSLGATALSTGSVLHLPWCLRLWIPAFRDLHCHRLNQCWSFCLFFFFLTSSLKNYCLSNLFSETCSNGQLTPQWTYLPLCELLAICDVITSLWQLQHLLTLESHFRKVLNLFLASFSEI